MAIVVLSLAATTAVTLDPAVLPSILDPHCTHGGSSRAPPELLKRAFDQGCQQWHRSSNGTLVVAAVEAYESLRRQGMCTAPVSHVDGADADGQWDIMRIYARVLPAGAFCTSIDKLLVLQEAARRGSRQQEHMLALLSEPRWPTSLWSGGRQRSFETLCRKLHPSLHPADRKVEAHFPTPHATPAHCCSRGRLRRM